MSLEVKESNEFLHATALRNIAISYRDIGKAMSIYKIINVDLVDSIDNESMKCFQLAHNFIELALKIESEFLKLKDLYNLAYIEEAEGNFKIAERILTQILESNVENPTGKSRILRHWAICLQEQGKHEEAISILHKIEKPAKDSVNNTGLTTLMFFLNTTTEPQCLPKGSGRTRVNAHSHKSTIHCMKNSVINLKYHYENLRNDDGLEDRISLELAERNGILNLELIRNKMMTPI